MNRNHKIQKLIEAIPNCNPEEFVDVITKLDLTLADFEGQIHFSEERYTRTCVAKNEEFELILIGWAAHQKTAIHNHNGEEGYVYLINGSLKEETFKRNKNTNSFTKTGESILAENQVAVAKNHVDEFHALENLSDQPSLSLHMYRKPMKSCLVYDEKADEINTKNLFFDFV